MFSRTIRRIHMYLGLFLAPWMLLYAASTIAMNHRAWFQPHDGGALVVWEKEAERAWAGEAPAGPSGRAVAARILEELGMNGAHTVDAPDARGQITIVRSAALAPRRIRYLPEEGKLVVEKQVFRAPLFLERMHRRAGYQQPYLADDLWALAVDAVVIAMAFWAFSGLWMWWEIRAARAWGLAFAVLGLGLFVLFLATI
ncbi:MAG: hypothetical protein RMK57_14465 [Bryobacterales bacterium]|nr:PepSY domain-containing protein [Bryobacteraceae bacterium]MDW8355724.1 hypothetical protein [Bryobacterales bacterium]